MPSRKKAKGKARKAAKQAAKAKESEAAVAANQRLKESLEAQTQRLQISQIHGLLSMKCHHGFDGKSTICHEFIETIIPVFLSSQDNVLAALKAVHEATAEKYADVYSSKLESIVSIFSAVGTEAFLRGDINSAQLYAALTCHFEELIAVYIGKTKALVNWTKILELDRADDHTLAKFFRKRIPCHCLDEKYKEVKSVKKMGMCYNLNCSQPGRKAERSKMLCCTRCGAANYCSIECQKNDWKKHKEICANIAEEKAAFQAKQLCYAATAKANEDD